MSSNPDHLSLSEKEGTQSTHPVLCIHFLPKPLVNTDLATAFSKQTVNMPTDSFGNMTGHLIGILYRALLCKELGI